MRKTLLNALKHGSGTILSLFLLFCTCQGVWADYTYNLYMYVSSAPTRVYIWDANDNYIGTAWHGTTWGDLSKTPLWNGWYKHTVTSPTTTYGMLVNDGGSGKSGDIKGLQDAWVKIEHSTSASSYGIPSEYYIPGSFNSWSTSSTSFSEFDESHAAFKYTTVLDAGSYTYRIYKGGWYGTSANNDRGNFTGDLTKDGSGNLCFTIDGRKKVTFYYDPGADVSFLDVDEACTTPTVGAVSGDVATEECEGTVELSVSPTGGTAPLSYQWFKNDTQSASGGTAVTGKTSSNTYTPLSGSFFYYCEVYSAGECEASYHASSNPTTYRVQIKDAPVVTASATVITNYTPVVVSAAGPNVVWTKDVKSGTDENSYLYKPTNSSVIFKGKGNSGTVVYTVTGTAENGCFSSVDISVSQDVDICQ